MAKQSFKSGAAKASAPGSGERLVRAGLDALSFGFAVFDRDLRLVTSNEAFRTLRGYPTALCRPGTEIVELYRFNAERGDYGPGEAEAQARSRLDRVRQRRPHELEYELATGRILIIRYAPIAGGGLLMSYADITERKRAEEAVVAKHEQHTRPIGFFFGSKNIKSQRHAGFVTIDHIGRDAESLFSMKCRERSANRYQCQEKERAVHVRYPC